MQTGLPLDIVHDSSSDSQQKSCERKENGDQNKPRIIQTEEIAEDV